jgi:hypothetical protein
MRVRGSATLREDFPALGLVLGFVRPRERELMADLLLLWMEINRARNADESMIAAVRLTWWRDALKGRQAEGVPLAERLIRKFPHPVPVTDMLDKIITITLDQGTDSRVCHTVGDFMATVLNRGEAGGDIAHILLAFRGAMAGKALDTKKARPLMAAKLPVPFKLMAWLALKPERLAYPESQSLLPLKMLIKAVRL